MHGPLTEIALRPAYHKGQDDIAGEFYLPCMARAIQYDRAVGFFNSTAFIIAWPSLKDFVARGGKIRVLCSPALTPADIEALDEGYFARAEESAGARLRHEIRAMLDNPFLAKPTRVLASLVALGVLSLRVVFVGTQTEAKHRRLFHDKLGIFHDSVGNVVVFKGSMNETWAGLSADGNLESVDVFVTGVSKREDDRISDEIAYFEALWNEEYPSVAVREFPQVAREQLVSAADPKNWPDLVNEICSEMEALAVISADRRNTPRVPRPHQARALDEWQKRGRRGILEHATGSGKTFTALCAIRDAFQRGETPIVLVPTQLLLRQWEEEIRSTFQDLDLQMLLCGAGNTRWRDERLLGPWTSKSDKPRLVLATTPTAAGEGFMRAIRQGDHLFLVADEVHTLGSPEHRKVLQLISGPRLGLSATPRRARDPVGTEAIMQYFGGIVPPPFTLRDAIAAGTLTPYFYFPQTVDLSEEEQEEWNHISADISQLYARRQSQKASPDIDGRIDLLLIKRARIAKRASGKTKLAVDVLRASYHVGQRWIVYCESLAQLNDILLALRKAGIDAGEYHSAMSGDREQTLRHFEINGGVLVSIRCLDEGVDIPSVSHALILASSKNPREFIQRRGRVLRRAENKSLAFIHDAIVVPRGLGQTEPGSAIVEGELARAVQFGREAENPSAITDLELIAKRFGLDLAALSNEGVEEDG